MFADVDLGPNFIPSSTVKCLRKLSLLGTELLFNKVTLSHTLLLPMSYFKALFFLQPHPSFVRALPIWLSEHARALYIQNSDDADGDDDDVDDDASLFFPSSLGNSQMGVTFRQ